MSNKQTKLKMFNHIDIGSCSIRQNIKFYLIFSIEMWNICENGDCKINIMRNMDAKKRFRVEYYQQSIVSFMENYHSIFLNCFFFWSYQMFYIYSTQINIQHYHTIFLALIEININRYIISISYIMRFIFLNFKLFLYTIYYYV